MKFTTYFLLFFVSLFVLSCQGIGKKSQVTVQTRTLSAQSMTQTDKFGDQNRAILRRDTPLSNLDHFPKIMSFSALNMERPMYVRAKDKMVTVIDRGDTLGFEGVKYPDESIILQELHRRFSLFQGYTLGLNRRRYDLNYAYLSSKKIYEEQKIYLESAFKKFKVGRDFKKQMQREIRYSYFCNLLGPYSITNTNVDSISPIFVETLNGCKKDLQNAIKTRKGTDKNVHTLVYDYNRFLSRKAMATDTAFDYQWLTVDKNFKGETREYIKFRLLKENFGAIGNYESAYNQFKTTCKDKDFVAYLDRLAVNNTHIFNAEELTSSLQDTAGQKLTWANILEKNKGKKIYLIVGNAYTLQLFGKELTEKAAYFEKHETQIVFVLTDRKKEQWQKVLETVVLPNFQQYYLGASDLPIQRVLEQPFSFVSTHFLDKTGRIALKNAANPNKQGLLMRQLVYAVR